MGVLGYPRIHFRGTCSANAATGDNDDVVVNIDTSNVTLLKRLQSASTAEAKAWMTSGRQAISPINQKKFWYVRSGWNYFGDLSTRFLDVKVCSVVDLDGQTSTTDAIVGGGVKLLGSEVKGSKHGPTLPIMCDVNPVGSAACQIFIGGLSIGNDLVGLKATYDTSGVNRWISFRNATTYPGEQNYPGAGAIWQLAIPYDALTFLGESTSPALAELAKAASQARGIVIQFAFYQFCPKIPDLELIARFQAGDDVSNPCEGILVGTIGVWDPGDLKTVPDGRWLLPPPSVDPNLYNAFGMAAVFLGPAAARVQPDSNVVSLNLISTFPDVGYLPDPLSKADLGRVSLGYIPEAGGDPVPIGLPIDYDYLTYELTGGIIDVAYDPTVVDRGQLDRGTLVLLTLPTPKLPATPLVSEARSVISIRSDDGAVYLEVDQEVEVNLLALERGRAPSEAVTIYLWEFQYVTDPGGPLQRAFSILRRVESGTPLVHRLEFEPTVVFPAGQATSFPVKVKGLRPGGAVIAFTTDPTPPSGPNPWGVASYASLRVMPVDDYSDVPIETRLSWKFIYNAIFKYYDVIFPAMSKVIAFDDQKVMEAAAPQLVKATDPALKAGTLYMPPSRDLSKGKRELLVEWAESLARRSGKRKRK